MGVLNTASSIFADILKDQSTEIVKGADISLAIAIIAIPYIYFQFPGYQLIPPTLSGIFNWWLLIGGILMILSLIKGIIDKVSIKCPNCKNTKMRRVTNPKWECTLCDWKQK